MKLIKFITLFFYVLFSLNAFADLLEDAQNGNAEAQFQIGWEYFVKKRVAEDEETRKKEAIKWLSKAAEQNLPKAQYYMGTMYQLGFGVEQSSSKYVEWLTKAATGEMVNAQFQLAELYIEGKLVEQDMVQARFWLEKAAEQNHSKAQLYLANFYFQGIGVTPDLDKAKQLLLKAAEKDAQAQYIIGESYYFGDHVPEDKIEAKKWFEKSAGNGYERALDFLGRNYPE